MISLPPLRAPLRLAAWAALCLAGAAARAGAVVPFTFEGQAVVSSFTAHSVVPDSSVGWRMYLSSGGFHIVSAASPDQDVWTLEAGVRLSTSATPALDSSSITACAVVASTQAGEGFRMFYVAISSAGHYHVLSATSADGLTWAKEPGVRLSHAGRFLDSPALLQESGSLLRMYYVADAAGAGSPADFRVHGASSSDAGITWGLDGQLLSGAAYQVAVTTLADGRTRLYYSAPLTGETTASQVLSAESSNGTSFSLEDGVRLSTPVAAASLTYPVVVRSTEGFRWRMFATLQTAGPGPLLVSRALTLNPVPRVMDPDTVLNAGTAVSFTLTGEVFGPNPSVTFSLGSDSIVATGVTRVDEDTITGTLNPFQRPLGHWNATVTNQDSYSGALARAFLLTFPDGSVSVLDNLFRPLKGGSAQVTVETFNPGRVTAKLYTSNGGLVSTLLDQELPAGTHTVAWDGRTSAGNTVASGVYILSVRGPKIETTRKIVVIK